MSNNINWIGNKVLDSSPSRQIYKPVSPLMPTSAPTSFLTQQGGSVSAAIPKQQSSPDPVPAQQGSPIVIDPKLMQQGPPPSSEIGYIPYYLASNIGKNIRAEFIIGSNMYADKTGVLTEVGINYFVIDDVGSRTHIMCDLYSVKFVTILQP